MKRAAYLKGKSMYQQDQAGLLSHLSDIISKKEQQRESAQKDEASTRMLIQLAQNRLSKNGKMLIEIRSDKRRLMAEEGKEVSDKIEMLDKTIEAFLEQMQKDRAQILDNQKYGALFAARAQSLEIELNKLREQYNTLKEKIEKSSLYKTIYFLEGENGKKETSTYADSSSADSQLDNKDYTP
jgi:hypothetical protein